MPLGFYEMVPLATEFFSLLQFLYMFSVSFLENVYFVDANYRNWSNASIIINVNLRVRNGGVKKGNEIVTESIFSLFFFL